MKKCLPAFIALCLGVLSCVKTVHAQDTGSIVGWGSQVVVEQSELEGLVALAGGAYHSLGLKSDGSIVAWGKNGHGQCKVPRPMPTTWH